MKYRHLLSLAPIVILLVLVGCYPPPEFPPEPAITFVNVEFKEATDPPSARDTLALTIHFTDGDGDLGLAPEEDGDESLYRQRNYFFNEENGDTLQWNDPQVADIPYEFPYTCLNWELVLRGYTEVDGVRTPDFDTLYYEINDNHYNITVDFFYKPDGQAEWEELDWRLFREPSCGETFDGRFPILYEEEEAGFPLEGDMRYTMVSDGFLSLFGADSMRLEVEIKDRALNRSNKLVTPSFTLPNIRN